MPALCGKKFSSALTSCYKENDMKGIKWFVIGVCLAAVFMIPPVLAGTLEAALKDSEPVERGTCLVEHIKFGTLLMECVRGQRSDGATLFAIIDNGEIIAVYEQSKKDEAPKKIWSKDWQET